MKRDARLYDIVQSLRDGRLHTAAELGQRLGVSTRTIWRDMEMLAATGLPVTGERGLGEARTDRRGERGDRNRGIELTDRAVGKA